MDAFDYVNAILTTKKDLITDEQTEKAYVPFLTNRALSYHKDTIFYAQEMNMNHHIDKKLQFSYLINKIRPNKRKFSKWAKRKEDNDIDAIQEYFGYSIHKAKVALSILSKNDLQEIRKKLEKGGLK
jgi:fructose-1-phosphate kinase PfkB-like protein